MNIATSQSVMRCALPAEPLRAWIDHYWLSLGNDRLTHAIMPDGAIDLVMMQAGMNATAWVYGTSTSSQNVGLEHGAHYLGIRFKPGQGRHFLKAAAKELTDHREPISGLLSFSLDSVAEHVASADIFDRIDTILLAHAMSVQPMPARIDAAVALIASARGMLRVDQAADVFGTGRRQFERVFLDTVGIAPKLFASIARFHHAGRLIREAMATTATTASTAPAATLGYVAHACGYADQSHMNRDFRRLSGMAPSAYARRYVAFVQDAAASHADNERACSTDPGERK